MHSLLRGNVTSECKRQCSSRHSKLAFGAVASRTRSLRSLPLRPAASRGPEQCSRSLSSSPGRRPPRAEQSQFRARLNVHGMERGIFNFQIIDIIYTLTANFWRFGMFYCYIRLRIKQNKMFSDGTKFNKPVATSKCNLYF